MSAKKVCIITTVHQVMDVRIFYKQAKSLYEAGFDVTLIAQNHTDETIDGIKVIGLHKPANRIQRIIGLSYAAFKTALKQEYDIYHFHDPELLFVGILLKLVTGKKVIYDVHEDYPQSIKSKYWIPSYMRNLVSVFMSITEKIAVLFMDAIITVTDTIEAKFDRKKTLQVRNYPIINFSEMSYRRETNISTSVNLIYVGGINVIRGIKELVKAIEIIETNIDIKLNLLGKFIPASLENEIKSSSAIDKINYLGWLTKEETIDMMMKSDIGIVTFHPEPNHINSLPNKMFEYMAVGLPVIASNFDSWIPYIVENQCGVLVNPLSPEDIANAIEKLASDHELRIRMGQQGRQAVLDKYNWDSEKNKLLNLYNKLLNG